MIRKISSGRICFTDQRHPINVPLRDRADDMVELFKTFLAKYNALFDKHVTVIEPEVMEIFRQIPAGQCPGIGKCHPIPHYHCGCRQDHKG